MNPKQLGFFLAIVLVVLVGGFVGGQILAPKRTETTTYTTTYSAETRYTTLYATETCYTTPTPSTKTTPKYMFVGSTQSDIYHWPSCYWAKQIHPHNEIWFKDSADARAHGYRPCKVCKPP